MVEIVPELHRLKRGRPLDPRNRCVESRPEAKVLEGARPLHLVDGVVERGGESALARLWESARELPTPNEVVAPGLWLARIDIDDLGLEATVDEEE